MAKLKKQLGTHNVTLEALLTANEMALTGRTRAEINRRIDQILDSMHKAVRRGIRHKGTLPGSIRLSRKAPILYRQAKGMSQPGVSGWSALRSDSFLIFLNAYCLAASEENAAGSIVVTAIEAAAEIAIEYHLGMTCDGSGRPSHRRVRADPVHRTERHGGRESLQRVSARYIGSRFLSENIPRRRNSDDESHRPGYVDQVQGNVGGRAGAECHRMPAG